MRDARAAGARRLHRALVLLVAAAWGATPALGRQSVPPEPGPGTTDSHAQPPVTEPAPASADPQLTSEGVEGTLEGMRRRANETPPPLAPTLRRVPAAVPPGVGQARGTDPDLGVPGARRLREGTFLSRRAGAMLRVRTGDWVFVPRPERGGEPDRPMVVLASQGLERLEGMMRAGVERPNVSISGQVFAYRGREYLLPGEPLSVLGDEPAEPASSPTEAAPAGPAQVEDLIRDLETRRAQPRALSRGGAASNATGTPGRVEGVAGAGDARALAEGALITARRGRIIRLGDGRLAFTPDNDADSTRDRALVLVPCQALSRLEDVSLWRGDGLTLELSGRVLTYRGGTYLLPTMFVIPAQGDVTPLQ